MAAAGGATVSAIEMAGIVGTITIHDRPRDVRRRARLRLRRRAEPALALEH